MFKIREKAQKIELTHPAIAYDFNLRFLNFLISQKNSKDYNNALKTLLEISDIWKTSEPELFNKLLHTIRTKFKTKRSMMKLIKENFGEKPEEPSLF